MQSVPTMKTIEETAKYFNLPKHFCRKAVLDGKVVYVKAGTKYLINTERFTEWLNNGEQSASEPETGGKIRRLN